MAPQNICRHRVSAKEQVHLRPTDADSRLQSQLQSQRHLCTEHHLPTTGNTSGAQRLEIINSPAGYAYSHTSLPGAESFTIDISAQDSEHDPAFDPDMLPDEGTSTG